MSMTIVRRVAVVGAGLSGLPTIKHCLEEGLEPVCFEMKRDLGGLWNYTDEVEVGWSSVTRSTVANLSKETFCYSDFPVPDYFPVFMPHEKVIEYLKLYAKKFDLEKCILFDSQVVEITQADDFQTTGRWIITVNNTRTGTSKTEVFDAVLICAGHHSIPYRPEYEGQVMFRGSIMHSQEYRDWKGFEDKRVVVVGVGNSALEVACELSRICSRVFLSSRRGLWLVSRSAPDGSPIDLFILRRVMDALISILPASLANLIFVTLLQLGCDHELLGLEPAHTVLSQKFVINDEVPSLLLSGKIKLKGKIKKLMEDSVVFEDGSIEKTDVVINATGYEIGFPFVKNPVFEGKEVSHNLYKYVFPPEIKPSTIAAIGYVETQGSILAAAELHSRWAVQVLKGEINLPSQEEMNNHISMRKDLLIRSTNGSHAISWSLHLDDVAEEIGCRPHIFKIFLSDPLLALYMFFGPLVPSHYRLVGPGAWSGARRNILTVAERIAAPLRSGKGVRGNWRTVRLMLCVSLFVLAISFFLAFIC